MSLADLQQEVVALPPEERLRLAAFLESLGRDEPTTANRPRVRLPLIPCPAGTVIDPTKDALDASLWD